MSVGDKKICVREKDLAMHYSYIKAQGSQYDQSLQWVKISGPKVIRLRGFHCTENHCPIGSRYFESPPVPPSHYTSHGVLLVRDLIKDGPTPNFRIGKISDFAATWPSHSADVSHPEFSHLGMGLWRQ